MLTRTLRTYLGNAVSVRDFRVGLRGNRSALLLGLYLFLLIAVSLLVYDSSTANVTLSQAQGNLRSFYATIMGMVTFAACAIATATGATAIVMEVQRRQLELVTMTAAPPRYLLVGKLISSFRYTWMVLILSLPITASCVVLGGATWTSVVLSYVLISFFALLCSAIGLSISTHVKKPTAAIGWAFAAVGVYAFGSTMLAAIVAFSSGSSLGTGRGGASHIAPFAVLLSPGAIALPEALDTTTLIGRFEVPNIFLAVGTILLIVRYLLHVGGLAISHRSPRTIAYFRIDSAITLALVSLALGVLIAPLYVGAAFRMSGSAAPTPTYATGVAWGWLLITLLMGVGPVVSSYGFDAGKLVRPDRAFRLREALSGRPSGGLPFILLLLLTSAAAYAIGFKIAGADVGPRFFGTIGFVLAYALAVWALTRQSASNLVGSKQASTAASAFSVLFVFGLLAFFFTATLNSWYKVGEQGWMLYPMRPILGDDLPITNLTHGSGFLLLAVLFFVNGERRLARKLSVPPTITTLPPVNHVPAS